MPELPHSAPPQRQGLLHVRALRGLRGSPGSTLDPAAQTPQGPPSEPTPQAATGDRMKMKCRDCELDEGTTECGKGWSRTHGPSGCIETRVLPRVGGSARVEIGGVLYGEDSRGFLRKMVHRPIRLPTCPNCRQLHGLWIDIVHRKHGCEHCGYTWPEPEFE